MRIFSLNFLIILTLVLLKVNLSYSQEFTNEDLKTLSVKLNTEFKDFVDPSTNVKGRGVTSMGRMLVYQYDVPKDWYPFENLKELLIKSLRDTNNHKMYINQEINIGYYYFKDNIVYKTVRIGWEELKNDKIILDEYIVLTNHPKSNGIEYKLKSPVGWEVKEGDRPHIVKKFIDDDKIFMIQINETGQFFSKNEIIKKFELEDEVNLLIESFINDSNINYSNPKVVTVDNHPFLYTNYNIEGERLGINFKIKSHLWISIIEDQLVSFMGMGDNYNDYFKIMNSVVFLNQY